MDCHTGQKHGEPLSGQSPAQPYQYQHHLHHQDQQQQQQEQQTDGEDCGPSSGGPAGSPGSVLARLQTRFQQSSEDLRMAKEQNAELERRITLLTEQILAANEEKEAMKAEHRAALSRLEEAALAERRRYENALCSVRQQQQRGQMDLQLATDELAALRGQLKTLQLEKVGLARQVRDLETEVKARCRLHQNASDQMVRFNQAKNKLNKEVAGLMEWLKRLESESRSAAELNGRLQLLLQHQRLQLEQLARTAAADGDSSATPCPELEQLRALLAAAKNRSITPPPPPTETEDFDPPDSLSAPAAPDPPRRPSSPDCDPQSDLLSAVRPDDRPVEAGGDGPGSSAVWEDSSCGSARDGEEMVNMPPPPLAVPPLVRQGAGRPV